MERIILGIIAAFVINVFIGGIIANIYKKSGETKTSLFGNGIYDGFLLSIIEALIVFVLFIIFSSSVNQPFIYFYYIGDGVQIVLRFVIYLLSLLTQNN